MRSEGFSHFFAFFVFVFLRFSWWEFRPRKKKYFSPPLPLPLKHPPDPSPPRPHAPALPGIFYEKSSPPPPSWPLGLPFPPYPEQKKLKYIETSTKFSFFFFRFSSLFFAFLRFQDQKTVIYWANGEFHSDPVCTDPVQNFPNLD